ncbi:MULTISPECIES: hypothetical protein [unclassified Bacillus (in: firmicutes)]|uniref:hypothetical protein n=1 Tax=unclassified Bacillus (in: firmicutes) TaxID=185979 RepID=UPI00227DBDCF|nr:hypothetical protein [Bacillus sp. S20C3]MCY8288818.1 hypothetical protein [Bacillus sp. N13C7]MCY8719427.1 hypothetical protein [Bacillus sp. S10C12M]MCY9142173.1 hypothetical protein [Bacillus sp. T9C1]
MNDKRLLLAQSLKHGKDMLDGCPVKGAHHDSRGSGIIQELLCGVQNGSHAHFLTNGFQPLKWTAS